MEFLYNSSLAILQILRWRSGASVTWSIAALPVITLLYMFAANFYIHHPLLWIIGTNTSSYLF